MIGKIFSAFSRARNFTFMKPKNLIAIQLLTLFFIVAVSAASAQSAKKDIDISPALGPSIATITKVTNRGTVGDDTTLVIKVEWTTQTLPNHEFLEFAASVEVEYADGSKNNSNSQSVGATARLANLRVLDKGTNVPRKFTARLTTRFNFLDANFINRTDEFVLNTANSFDTANNASPAPASRPSSEAFGISRVRAKFDGCAPVKHCFIIDWGTTPRPSLQLNQVSLSASITYLPNQTRSDAASANASARTATLKVDDPKVKFNVIKVNLTTKVSATITTSKNTQLTGSF